MVTAATIQLCTYNRAALLERVLDACFEQTVDERSYEVVLVDDGSQDETPAVIERARPRAACRFTVVRQSNRGLAAARNAGIERAQGTRIIFIDDDVLPLPNFVQQHLASHASRPEAIVRGGAIEVETPDVLPVPIWGLRNYSGNYFWTTNVSAPLETIRAIGGFDESFSEYGWEDIDVGLRLRARGVRAVFNPKALVYHIKPRPAGRTIARMLDQARAQARTAVKLVALHPNWRAYLTTGINPAQRGLHRIARSLRRPDRLRRQLDGVDGGPLSRRNLATARALANETYFEELERMLEA